MAWPYFLVILPSRSSLSVIPCFAVVGLLLSWSAIDLSTPSHHEPLAPVPSPVQPGVVGNIQDLPNMDCCAFGDSWLYDSLTPNPISQRWSAIDSQRVSGSNGFTGGIDPQTNAVVQQSDINTAATQRERRVFVTALHTASMSCKSTDDASGSVQRGWRGVDSRDRGRALQRQGISGCPTVYKVF